MAGKVRQEWVAEVCGSEARKMVENNPEIWHDLPVIPLEKRDTSWSNS
jgi:hypothetical protein